MMLLWCRGLPLSVGVKKGGVMDLKDVKKPDWSWNLLIRFRLGLMIYNLRLIH